MELTCGMAERPAKRETLYAPRVIELGYVVLALTMVTPVSALSLVLLHGRAPTLAPLLGIGLFVASVLGFVAYFMWRIAQLRRLIRTHGRFLCLNCHYPLNGLPDAGRCPECDQPYERATTEKRWLTWELTVNKERPFV